MKIHRYIYTRLTKDLSPTGKGGFQSAFLPGDLLASKEVLEIESHIHVHDGLKEKGDSTVFYKQIKGEFFLVLLLLRPLSDVKDEHGRGGAFLCEGFLVAEKDWRPMNVISELRDLVAPHRFASLTDLLSSPDVDTKAGKIKDLELPFTPNQGRRLDEEEDEPAAELLMAVYHVAHTQNRELAVVLQGEPAEVTEVFEICSTFLPDPLRPLIGWDDAFDGGKIFFSPLRIFGYTEILPVTGRPAVFTSRGAKVKWPDPEIAAFGQPSDPYSNWLLEVCVNPVPRPMLNAMYALSQAMVSKLPTGPNMQSDPLFELVNREAIGKLYVSGLQQVLGDRWLTQLLDATNHHDQLMCWMRGYPPKEITEALEWAILSKDISPEMIPDAPNAKIIAQGSPTLQLLAAMWTNQIPEESVLSEIPENQRIEAMTLILHHGVHKHLPFLPVLSFFRNHISGIQRDDKVTENLGIYIQSKIPSQYLDFKVGMIATVMELGDYDCLVDPGFDWLLHLNRWFALTGGNEESWKAAKRLGKTENFNQYTNIQAFALGSTLPLELSRKGEGRFGLLSALVKVHGKTMEELLDMGFFKAEIEKAGGKSSLMTRIKRLFGG
jgi:hypothetical protein